MTPNALMDYESTHAPAGFTATGGGSGGGTVTQSFRTAVNQYVVLRLTASAHGSGSNVWVNAQVVWPPVKPLGEVIAARVTEANLSYVAPKASPGDNPGPTTKLTLRGTALARLVDALNNLQVRTNVSTGCGYPTGETATLRVRNRGQIVVFTITLTGCLMVHVTSGDTTEPILDDTDEVNAAVRAAVGRA